jgi:Flp pilus assembly protein TadD
LALADLSEAARLAPQASEIQNHLGLALAETGHHDRAVAAFERAVRLDCRNVAALENLAAATEMEVVAETTAERRDRELTRAMAIVSNSGEVRDE